MTAALGVDSLATCGSLADDAAGVWVGLEQALATASNEKTQIDRKCMAVAPGSRLCGCRRGSHHALADVRGRLRADLRFPLPPRRRSRQPRAWCASQRASA